MTLLVVQLWEEIRKASDPNRKLKSMVMKSSSASEY